MVRHRPLGRRDLCDKLLATNSQIEQGFYAQIFDNFEAGLERNWLSICCDPDITRPYAKGNLSAWR